MPLPPTSTEPPFASEKRRTRRKYKENIVPLNIHRKLILAFFFFFLLFDVRPLLLKISGPAHDYYPNSAVQVPIT